MARAAFGRWGADLNPDDFASALAAFSLWQTANRRGVRTPQAIGDQIFGMLNAGIPADLREGPAKAPPAADFVAAWRHAMAPGPPLTRLGVRIPSRRLATLPWLLEQLQRPSVGLGGVYIETPSAHRRFSWSWPLRVAILDDGDSAIRRELAESKLSMLERFVELLPTESSTKCDLLLVPAALRDGAAAIIKRQVTAAAIIFLSRLDEPTRRAQVLIEATMRDTGAAALGFVSSPDQGAAWLDQVMFTLSHNESLDVALSQAARSTQMPPPILFADPEALDEMRVSRVLDHLETEVRLFMEPESLDLDVKAEMQRSETHREWFTAAVRRIDFARVAGWDSESAGATPTAAIARSLTALAAVEPPKPRWIQARLFDDGAEEVTTFLRPSSHYQLHVRIGALDAAWSSLPVEFNDESLPTRDENQLNVALIIREPQQEPQSARIILPARGNSTECVFHVVTGTKQGLIDARIIVSFAGRILQTALVHVVVSSTGDISPDDFFRLAPEADVRSVNALDGRSAFEAAVAVDGKDATTLAGDHVDIVPLEGIRDAVEKIRKQLEARVADDAPAKPKLQDDSVLSTLVLLARHGSLLRAAFRRRQDAAAAKIAKSPRIQIVSLNPEGFFPIEFVYEGVSPRENAVLCPRATEALQTGKCPDCRSQTNDDTVCPSGFWGLTKVIERESSGSSVLPVGTLFRVEPSAIDGRIQLPRVTSALLAAASKVDLNKKDSRLKLARRIATLLGRTPPKGTWNKITTGVAHSWSEWKTAIEDGPPLLVLLPHTGEDDTSSLAFMEIEENDHLAVDAIKQDYIGRGPIVLLLGCNTGEVDVPFEQFTVRFRENGAAIVLTTLTKVRGPQAAIVASEVVRQLTKYGPRKQATFGDVMLAVRRRLLLAGLPVGMALTAYGDADWTLGGP